MNASAIPVGTKVELELFNSLDSKTYSGEFEEVISNMEVIIFSAKQGSAPMDFSEKTQVSAIFSHQLHGLLRFKGSLMRKEETKSGIKFHIRIDSDFHQIQKREYFRPICQSRAEYRLVKDLNDIDEEQNAKIPYKNTKTRNISFKGVCILINDNNDVSKNDLIDLRVWLKYNHSIEMRCKIIRMIKFEINEKKYYELGMSIEDISEKDRNFLTDFLTRSAMINSLFWGETPFNN